MAEIDNNISQLFGFAKDALNKASSQAGRINRFVPNAGNWSFNYDVTKPSLDKPARLSDMLPPDATSQIKDMLDNAADDWLKKFFPEIYWCLRQTPEQWLCGIITGQKPFGMSEEVFRAIWHQGRDREYRARNSAVEQLRAEYSARGFSLPPGAMVASINRAEEQASDAIAEVNRTQMIRDSEIKLDLLKFAEEQAIRLKLGIFQALADFYRVWITLPNKGLEEGRMKVDAYASLNRALSDYYRVELGFEELRMRAAELRMNGQLEASSIRVRGMDQSYNSALGNAADGFSRAAGDVAGAASTLIAQVVETGSQ